MLSLWKENLRKVVNGNKKKNLREKYGCDENEVEIVKRAVKYVECGWKRKKIF